MSRTLTITDRERILAKAWSKRGVGENPPYSNRVFASAWWGYIGPWCAMFVSWAFYTVLGFSPFPATISKGFAYCPSGVQWFKDRGKWANKHTRPKRGWIVFFSFGGRRPDHVGIVLDVLSDGRIHTIEGNTSGSGSRDGGAVVDHYRSTSSIVGYGIIDYVADREPVPDEPEWQLPPFPGRTLQLGSRGQHVAVLKVLMIAAGYGKFMSTTGSNAYIFGSGTSAGVKELKRDHNTLVKLSGNRDPKALWAINDQVGPKTWSFIGWCIVQRRK